MGRFYVVPLIGDGLSIATAFRPKCAAELQAAKVSYAAQGEGFVGSCLLHLPGGEDAGHTVITKDTASFAFPDISDVQDLDKLKAAFSSVAVKTSDNTEIAAIAAKYGYVKPDAVVDVKADAGLEK